MTESLREQARAVLDSTWRPGDRFCPPNPRVYPHQWLWDSCFHAVAWAHLDDPRGVEELAAALSGQLDTGFVPHMRYFGETVSRGPLPDRSSYTQPPIYAHAARVLAGRGLAVPSGIHARIERALDWMWRSRRDERGLVFIVHPWESGADDSPRWDDWIGEATYDHDVFREHDRRLVEATQFDAAGAAIWSHSFVAAPAAFNAFTAHAFREHADATDDAMWQRRAAALSRAIDDHLWDEGESLWVDDPVVGGGPGARIPTLDGVFGSLSTADEAKANRALDQLLDDARFAAPFGCRYLPPDHPRYEPDEYWRGPAWPQLNYLLWVAANRWQRDDVAGAVARWSRLAATASGFAEYWNPETGAGLGAVPQGWAALAAAY